MSLYKTIYLQNRRFLPRSSELRKDKVKYVVTVKVSCVPFAVLSSFPDQCVEQRPPPRKKAG